MAHQQQQLGSEESPSSFRTIGGKGSKVVRHPSELKFIPERSASSGLTTMALRAISNGGGTGGAESPTSSSHEWSRPSSVGAVHPASSCCNEAILKWDEDEVLSWLHESGFAEYEQNFKDHSIRSGSILLSLEESHLKEMGVVKVGHRLEIMEGIQGLQREAGLLDRYKFIDLPTLVTDLEKVRDEMSIKLYPKRIILIRHAESVGNVDGAVYAHKPDPKLEITDTGKKQAQAAGVKLKELIGEELVSFYVSPFIRSKQTYICIREHFTDEQVVRVREEPRVREQEWGNFQDPTKRHDIMKERRAVGSFFYRFPTGESGADVYDRVSTYLESLWRDIEKGRCGENTIIVSHGLFCRLFLMRYYHWTVDRFHKLWNFDNCQFSIMEKQQNGSYELVTELKSD